MSHNPASAFLGYGYVLNKYEDCPMPSHLEDYGRNPEWEEWVDEFGDSDFYYPVDTYDNELCFFGIKLNICYFSQKCLGHFRWYPFTNNITNSFIRSSFWKFNISWK